MTDLQMLAKVTKWFLKFISLDCDQDQVWFGWKVTTLSIWFGRLVTTLSIWFGRLVTTLSIWFVWQVTTLSIWFGRLVTTLSIWFRWLVTTLTLPRFVWLTSDQADATKLCLVSLWPHYQVWFGWLVTTLTPPSFVWLTMFSLASLSTIASSSLYTWNKVVPLYLLVII